MCQGWLHQVVCIQNLQTEIYLCCGPDGIQHFGLWSFVIPVKFKFHHLQPLSDYRPYRESITTFSVDDVPRALTSEEGIWETEDDPDDTPEIRESEKSEDDPDDP
jgi:hypothetical protein